MVVVHAGTIYGDGECEGLRIGSLGVAGQNQEFYVAMLGLKCLLEIYVGCWIQKWSIKVGSRSLEFRGEIFHYRTELQP